MAKLREQYQETLDFMFSQLPMFQRIGAAAYKKDLTNMHHLLDFLGHPEKKFPSIHIAGTNGKGSTTHLLGAVLQAKGLKTGLLVSPHYLDFRERIKINGNYIDKAFVVDFIQRLRPVIAAVQPSFFELTTAMGFDYFAQQEVDVAVVEVGLGGRLDSTNVLLPVLSIITNISLDHTHLLGHTLPLIAKEKAGIIKHGIPVVIGETHPETKEVFRAEAERQQAPVYFADELFRVIPIAEDQQCTTFDVWKAQSIYLKEGRAQLGGPYQVKNLQTVFQAIELLPDSWKPDQSQIRFGLENLKSLTRFMGRWDYLQDNPRILADSAHNEAGIREAMQRLRQMPHQQLHILFGTVNDKELDTVLPCLPPDAKYYFAKAAIPRGMDADILRRDAERFGLKGRAYSSVRQALRAAKRNASSDDIIFIGGSIFVVAEVL